MMYADKYRMEIYNQIDNFNKTLSNPNDKKSKPFYEAYLYVPTNIAKDRAEFFRHVIKHKQFDKIIDLTFGSASLTSHIVLENDLEFNNLIFNDVEKNKDRLNIQITTFFTNTKITYKDVLDSNNFKEKNKYDLIIFNPQIGGNYTNGKIEFESIEPIIFNGTIDDYIDSNTELDTSNLTIKTNNREIFIYSEKYSKNKMENELKDIKIFNYNNVFYQSKKSKKEGKNTNIVKFRKTLDNISKDNNSIIVFYGNQKHYDILFKDYHYNRYIASDNGADLFVLSKAYSKDNCYKKNDNDFIIIENCTETNQQKNKKVKPLKDLFYEFDNSLDKLKNISNPWESIDKSSNDNQNDEIFYKNKNRSSKKRVILNELGNFNFIHKNILFKGVPGTGKSKTIDDIIESKLQIDKNSTNILRINIHSASSNADLMQGIGITTTENNQVAYHEKSGLIFEFIKQAVYTPTQPFVLVLEEIQENSLNELIGDLIYLIEDTKRTKIDITNIDENKEYDYQELIEAIDPEHYVKIPYLVDTSTQYRKMIMPDNLYIFCTSNYKDDKKVIEDNLLRRFDVVEIYPQYNDGYEDKDIAKFLKLLNKTTVKVFENNGEIHPDRFLIGHANWLKIAKDNEKGFYKALLKVVIDFKEIKEIDFASGIKEVFQQIDLDDKYWMQEAFNEVKTKENYKELIDFLQQKVYQEALTMQNNLTNNNE